MMDWWRRIVKFGFRLLYNELAFTYDTVSVIVSVGAWRCWQRAALKHLGVGPGAHVLELAHGTGNLQLDLHAAGYHPLGHDLSPQMGQIARRKLQHAGRSIALTRGVAQRLPFPSTAFDAVVCTFPTGFIIDPAALSEVRRVLKPQGRFVIVPNGVLTGGSPLDAGLEWLYRVTGQRDEGSFDFKIFFRAHGFEADVIQENCRRSAATVIIAHKMP